MDGNADLTALLIVIGNNDHNTAEDLLTTSPSLATAKLAQRDEFFLQGTLEGARVGKAMRRERTYAEVRSEKRGDFEPVEADRIEAQHLRLILLGQARDP